LLITARVTFGLNLKEKKRRLNKYEKKESDCKGACMVSLGLGLWV